VRLATFLFVASLACGVGRATAQGGGAGASGCDPQAPFKLPAATFVALTGDLLLRLQVETTLDVALLIVNRVDGNRLYDRRYWQVEQTSGDCVSRTLDYRPQPGAEPSEPQRMRLVLQPPELTTQPQLPRPLLVMRGELSGAGLPNPRSLQFEEVVLKREVGSGRSGR